MATETTPVQIRFDGSFAEGLEFVEVEDRDGTSVSVGEWTEDGEDTLLELEVAEDV